MKIAIVYIESVTLSMASVFAKKCSKGFRILFKCQGFVLVPFRPFQQLEQKKVNKWERGEGLKDFVVLRIVTVAELTIKFCIDLQAHGLRNSCNEVDIQ